LIAVRRSIVAGSAAFCRAVLIACAHVALPASSALPLQRLSKEARLSVIANLKSEISKI
jgi:hypothetical protein